MSERLACPIWECLPVETLVKLVLYQWEHYGTRPKFLLGMPFGDIESLEEIGRLMRQPTRMKRPPK